MKNNKTNNNNPISKPHAIPYAQQSISVIKTTGTLPTAIAIILKIKDISESFTRVEINRGIKYNNRKNKNTKGMVLFS